MTPLGELTKHFSALEWRRGNTFTKIKPGHSFDVHASWVEFVAMLHLSNSIALEQFGEASGLDVPNC